MMLGSPFWGLICDRFGRRICLFFCSLFIFIFGFVSSFSPSYAWMLVFRGLVGFGIGGAPQAFTLNSEFLPIKKRAKFTFFTYMFWTVGGCCEVVLAYLVMPTLRWRWLLGITSAPLLIFIVLCIWLPESARFQLISNKPDLALKTLKRIADDNQKDLPDGDLVGEVF
jgi:MFS family permease